MFIFNANKVPASDGAMALQICIMLVALTLFEYSRTILLDNDTMKLLMPKLNSFDGHGDVTGPYTCLMYLSFEV